MPKSLSALAVWAGLSLLLAGPLALLQTNISPLHYVTEATRHVMAGGTIYVNASAGGTNTGESWTNAYTTLSAAIAAAHADASVTTILVAKGTYYPTGAQNSTNRDAAFTLLRAGLTISGGYDAATGTRDISANTTTLSGDIGAAGTNTDNSYHVLVAAGIPAGGDSLIVDGFTVEKGYANGAGNASYGTKTVARTTGAGIVVTGNNIGNKLVFRNLTVVANNATQGNSNSGGGAYLQDASDMVIRSSLFKENISGIDGAGIEIHDCSPLILGCSFLSNTAGHAGGAIANYTASPIIRSCRFQGNSTGFQGGAISSYYDSNPSIENSLLSGNLTVYYGAAICSNLGGTTTIVNCTISGNKANGTAVFSENGVIIQNSILYGNSSGATASPLTILNSLVQNSSGGVGNIPGNTDPLFVNAVSSSLAPTTSGDYHLSVFSPAINKGDNTAVPGTVTTDLDGRPRILLSTVDLGVYESPAYTSTTPGDTLYVNQSATGFNTGATWTDAFTTFNAALSWVGSHANVKAILVSKGTYYPTGDQSGTDRSAAFVIPRAKLKIAGGYDAATGARNISANTTILSGDIGATGTSSDNSYHILIAAGIPAGADSLVVDGFTIEKGYANGSGDANYGSQTIAGNVGAGLTVIGNGIGNKLVLRNLTISENEATSGGGIYVKNASTMTVQSCVFKSNKAGTDGGALEIHDSSPLISNCTFLMNTAGHGGAGIANYTASSTIHACRFLGNSAGSQGGAVQSYNAGTTTIDNSLFSGNISPVGSAIGTKQGTLSIVNCTLSGNNSTNSSSAFVIYDEQASVTVKNSIVYGNIGGVSNSLAISYSLVQGYVGGTGNLPGTTNPLFVNAIPPSSAPATGGDYHLTSSSPAVNAGSNGALPTGLSSDLEGSPRIQVTIVDLGAYESSYGTPVVPAGNTLYVNGAAAGANTGTSWADAFTTLREAIIYANQQPAITSILVAKGTYYPTGVQNATNRDEALTIARGGLKILGGYDATTGTRNLSANETIISGEIGTTGDSDNSYHVFVIPNIDASADSLILDGLTITAANANGTGSYLYNGVSVPQNTGGALFASNVGIGQKFKLQQLTVRNNTGLSGACVFLSNNSSALVTDSRFINNGQLSLGIANSSPFVRSCTFLWNGTGIKVFSGSVKVVQSQFEAQGVALWSSGSATVYNSLFLGNTYAHYADGTGSIISINGTFYYNIGSNGRVHYIFFGGPQASISIKNGILSNNIGYWNDRVTFQNSLEVPYSGNPTPEEIFVNPNRVGSTLLSGDFRLRMCSPAINAGNNALVPSEMTTDLDGNPRIQFGTVDLGAYEAATTSNPATSPLASSAMSVSTIQSQTAKTDYFGNSCQELIASITGDGTPSSISGQTTMKVWLDATPVPHHVARHYEITPAANGSTATARVTLYFTQAEFNAFNTANPLKPLPTGPSDNTGKANLLVVKRPGVSGNGTGAYDSYTTAPLVIDPADTDIVWSGSRWEVSFNVTGFSGFFVSTQSALPLRLLSFTAKRTSGVSHLEWKTASEKNVSHFQVERSADAQEFSAIRTIPARNGESQTYTLDDVISIDGVMYYRLKMVDQDGSVTYSRTLSLTDQGAASMTDPALKLGPVPAKHEITLYLTRPEILGQEVQLTDQRGVVLDRLTITQLRQTYRVSGLVPGVYFFRLATGEAARFVKN